MKDQTILSALERLGAAFPWDEVCLHIDRKPEGGVTWWVVIRANPKFGLPFECKASDEVHSGVNALVDYAILQWSARRDPEKAREKKLNELKEQIEKLQAVMLGLPPFRPNRELAMSTQPASVDV